ncbi:pilus assembly protein CpaF [Silvibacterium bohemicum]|uniref:Pilus assembly protein CpaF n=1 Tax=Silvibacterium bohemicum TaxID=1577686 RepID=A0A841JMR2_9BACT|nr:CpaF family protein [Silvibacterium bohemicum]MBB6142646.1 pilus assembly protein CpaF [Silvibacterium bohemicum]
MNLTSIESVPEKNQPAAAPAKSVPEAQQQQIKSAVHKELIKRLDLDRLNEFNQTRAGQQQLFAFIQRLLTEHGVPLSTPEREKLAQEIVDEVFGLGPIEPLLHDPTVSDILVNTYDSIYVERHGRLEKTTIVFKDDRHLMHIIEKIVSAVGRRVDESSPMVDARLADGSRVNVIIPPLAIDGPILSIRRFGKSPLTAEDLIHSHTLTRPMLELLQRAVQGRVSIVISGGTGTGKTTLLNVLSSFISADERIVTIEDSAELLLRQDHVVRLETRPPNVEGRGAVRQRELMINALRMRPDRIVLGEVRGEEALDMLQAMNTGHDGSLTTVHANTPRDALSRLETMAMMGDIRLPERAIKAQIASAIQIIVQVARMSDGSRRITHISELTGAFSDTVSMNDLFLFERKGVTPTGKTKGRFHSTGIMPKFNEKLTAAGLPLPQGLINHSVEV